VALRLLAADPTFYGEGESAQALDTADDLTIRSVAERSKDTGTWNAMGLTADPDTGGAIYAILYASDGTIYIGGDFTDWNNTGTNMDRIARYTPSTALALTSATVRCVVWQKMRRVTFTLAERSQPCRQTARWTTWSGGM